MMGGCKLWEKITKEKDPGKKADLLEEYHNGRIGSDVQEVLDGFKRQIAELREKAKGEKCST
jgi:hypothetical protein